MTIKLVLVFLPFMIFCSSFVQSIRIEIWQGVIRNKTDSNIVFDISSEPEIISLEQWIHSNEKQLTIHLAPWKTSITKHMLASCDTNSSNNIKYDLMRVSCGETKFAIAAFVQQGGPLVVIQAFVGEKAFRLWGDNVYDNLIKFKLNLECNNEDYLITLEKMTEEEEKDLEGWELL